MSHCRARGIGLTTALFGWCLVSSFAMRAQTAAPAGTATPPATLAYDVVSIKPDKSENPNMRLATNESGSTWTNFDVADLISGAYGIKAYLISGLPRWADSTRFDIEAKLAPEDAAAMKKLDAQQRRATTGTIQQVLLADRFQLKTHIETKQLPVYDLVIVKGGPKFKEYDPAASHPDALKGSDGKPMLGGTRGSPTSFQGLGIPITTLINFMAYTVHRTIIDKTGLTGKYDVQINWAPDRDTPPDASADAAPSIFTAFEEQLGLKLIPDKGPVDTLVIDHIEQPSEN